MPTDLFLVKVLRTLLEVAGYCMLAQGLLWALAGKRREQNVVYQIFRIVTRPVFRLTRLIAPKQVHDQHIPFVAFFLVFWLWILLAFVKRYLCALHGVNCGL